MNLLEELKNLFMSVEWGDENAEWDPEPWDVMSAGEDRGSADLLAPPRESRSAIPASAPRTVAPAKAAEQIVPIRVDSTEDMARAARALREGITVLINLENTPPALVKSVADFLGGAVYALQGTIRRTSAKTWLLLPERADAALAELPDIVPAPEQETSSAGQTAPRTDTVETANFHAVMGFQR